MSKPRKKKVDSVDEAEMVAWNATSPGVAATRVLVATNGVEEQHYQALYDTLAAHGQSVVNGDMSRAEKMLMGQAEALQGTFSRLVELAMKADLLSKLDVYMRLALRAQNQSRMTLETLSTIKNPPVVIAKQANVVHGGNQQVNNQACPTHGEKTKVPNELLEKTYGNRLELGTQTEAVGDDSAMETVGALDGA